ncbi:MAG: GntR family transcriptional regulator [Kiritimatiellae bacterium]|nr:GntR family transcriptional regulator [Kiritimatiellia bacterium]
MPSNLQGVRAPKYLQIANRLAEMIATGVYRPGDKVPSERALAQDMSVSAVTANRAVSELVDRGLLHRRQGCGTFVREPQVEVSLKPIAFLYPGPEWALAEGGFYGSIFNGARRRLREAGRAMEFVTASLDPESAGKLDDLGVAGLISTQINDDDFILSVAARGVPMIVVDYWSEGIPGIDTVTVDSLQGSHDVVRHLIQLGHREIAHIGTESTYNPRRRVWGYRKAMQDAGLTPRVFWVEAKNGMQIGHHTMQKVFEEYPGVTAVACFSDLQAFGALRAVRERSLRVPEDISITGFGDMDQSEYGYVQITTVGMDKTEIGRRAAERLLERLANPSISAAARIVIPTHLLVRQSSGPPRTGRA